ncbi:MAG TPA: M23 family metallopeptidase [Vicinamibacterales bacterium]|nr:M23 family metallopeptidase [Vicinamibacterales bacterium]
MPARRYSFIVADRRSGVVRRFTISLWPAVATIVSVLALPILIGLGARWSARATIADLRTSNDALLAENVNYHEATGQLVDQIASLESAVNDIGARAAVDPAASRAMAKLPAIVKSRAMGGAPAAAVGSLLSSATGPGTALDVLKDLLGAIGSRLDSVRAGVEKRQALAAATPSIWPVAGWLSSPYGTRDDPFTGSPDFHPGLDISAEYGEAVHATADATVETAGPNGSYGNMVVLDHGFGIVTRYGHLSRIAVSPGQHVSRGEVVGYVGSTGRSTGPHLHYEIWMNGRLTNPMRLLANP